jgi:hypothetical protein
MQNSAACIAALQTLHRKQTVQRFLFFKETALNTLNQTTPLRLGCVVMAGGNARRYGSNKLAAQIDGKSLIRHALEAVPTEQFCRVVVVTQYPDIARLAEEFGFVAVCDPCTREGISHTITLGLNRLQDCDGAVRISSDGSPLNSLQLCNAENKFSMCFSYAVNFNREAYVVLRRCVIGRLGVCRCLAIRASRFAARARCPRGDVLRRCRLGRRVKTAVPESNNEEKYTGFRAFGRVPMRPSSGAARAKGWPNAPPWRGIGWVDPTPKTKRRRSLAAGLVPR